jgi:metal-dependent HD superfamily phosphatase/phosphodiesterase
MAWGSLITQCLLTAYIHAIGQHVERKSAVNYFHILNDFALLDLLLQKWVVQTNETSFLCGWTL